MSGVDPTRATFTASPAPAVPADDVKAASDLAHDRYTAARRHYTHLYVEFNSLEHPGDELAKNLDEARSQLLTLAGRLPQVLAGEPDAVQQELEAGPVEASESARTTNRFRIAELNRAAADAEASTWGWKMPTAHAG